MSILLTSKSEVYTANLELNSENNTFNFELIHPDKHLKGSGKWYICNEDYVLDFLILNCFKINGEFAHPENSIPYTGRKFIKNSKDSSYTLEGYFNPEDVILVLYPI